MARKRKTLKGFETITGRTLTENYCTMCEKTLHPSKFYQSLHIYINKNGLQSICKECNYTLYNDLLKELRSIPDTLEKYCQIVNFPFNERIVFDIKENVDNGGSRHPIAQYNQRIKTLYKDRDIRGEKPDLNLSFSEETARKYRTDLEEHVSVGNEFWGDSFEADEVAFLENNYQFFKETVDTTTHTEVTLLKQLCKKLLWLKEAEEEKKFKDIETLENGLQKLMKTLKISPSDIAISKSGTMKTAFGIWIRDIEENTPASFLEHEIKDGGMFHEDEETMRRYYYNHVERPLNNFLKGSFDPNVFDEDTGELVDGGV